jgi:hypothetical protein
MLAENKKKQMSVRKKRFAHLAVPRRKMTMEQLVTRTCLHKPVPLRKHAYLTFDEVEDIREMDRKEKKRLKKQAEREAA